MTPSEITLWIPAETASEISSKLSPETSSVIKAFLHECQQEKIQEFFSWFS